MLFAVRAAIRRLNAASAALLLFALLTLAALPAMASPAVDAACDAAETSLVLDGLPPTPGAAAVDVRVHYHRPDGQYGDWGLHLWQVNAAGQYVADVAGVTWDRPFTRSGIDAYGAYFDIPASALNHPSAAGFGFIVHPPGQGGDPGVDRRWGFTDGATLWLRSGDATIYRRNPLAGTPDIDTVEVRYRRYGNDYAQWGLHLWPSSGIDVTRLQGLAIDDWNRPVPFSAMPNYRLEAGGSEVVFDLPVLNPAQGANRSAVEFIIHGMPDNPAGGVNNKDGWNDNIRVSFAAVDANSRRATVWLVEGEPQLFTAVPDIGRASTADARAAWLNARQILWPRVDRSGRFALYRSARAQVLAVRGRPISGADGRIALSLNDTVPANDAERFRWLGRGAVLEVAAADDAALAAALDEQLVLVQEDAQGRVLNATTAQIAGQLDARYAMAETVSLGVDADLGRTRFALWAPTAQRVAVCVYGPRGGGAIDTLPATLDPATGVWRAQRQGMNHGRYYTYLVDTVVRGVGRVRNRVTDPYAISLDADSKRSYIADLDAPWLMPPGWTFINPPNTVREPEDMGVYELHVRDFSATDASVPARDRGKYGAFAYPFSAGMSHLRGLAQAGITDVHLLPAYDFASVPEANCTTPTVPMATPDSTEQQAAIAATRGSDCFNWGYDPWHYGAPEGSYASDASDGAARIREFRTMVMALHLNGLRVGMDVVYNHTAASGQNAVSVLDRVVPGYYHRLNANGDIERSTCCENTATENRMMAKLMIDTVVRWTRDYKISSFRFDLMGHQPRAAMERLRDVLRSSTGRTIPLLGEGWNFGEVANGARFVQASQLSLNGSGIGTFSDRARDHVRGGSGFDSGDALRRNQGYISGLFYADNGSGANASKNALMWSGDVIKVGLAGSIRDFELTTHWDARLKLENIDYNGQPAGYVLDPQEVVNYVENHDNPTLFDTTAFKLPIGTSLDDRARVQILGAATTAFSQGIAYWHAGIDTLRSKSLDRNSYDSGDWFNVLDWTYRDNGFGRGLPRQDDNGNNWSVMAPLLANGAVKPGETQIRFTRDAFRDLLRIRDSSRLFRLRTGAEVKQRLAFLNTGSQQVPTVLAATLDGRGYAGAGFQRLAYFINVDTVAQSISAPAEAGRSWRLHPVHRSPWAADRRAREASVDANGRFTIPARTAVVFVVD